MTNSNQQINKIRNHPGFFAALDHSGGNTPMESDRDFIIESRLFCLNMPQWASKMIWPITIMFVSGVIGAVVITISL